MSGARPIIFSGSMVRALLTGTKTQTRRVVKLPRERGAWEPTTIGGAGVHTSRGEPFAEQSAAWNTATGRVIACPYGSPGGSLYVKETWKPVARREGAEHLRYGVAFAADGAVVWQSAPTRVLGSGPLPALHVGAPTRWRSPLHLRRYNSRITLEVVSVRLERLQAITEEDARAEGVQRLTCDFGEAWGGAVTGDGGRVPMATARDAFQCLWDEINGKRAPWASNPYCWAVEFRRVQP